MGSEEPPLKEGVKQLIELATSCGRKFQNEQTGFVHYYYSKEDEKDNAAIPLYENMLFALALMRSKSADTVMEGKALFERLLPFQNFLLDVGKGGFPVYLHEYPHCRERLFGIKLLPVYCALLTQLNHILGSSLKGKLLDSSRALLGQCLQVHREKEAPYATALTLGLAAQALSVCLDDPSLKEEGKRIVDSLGAASAEACRYSPASLGELLIALQISEEAARSDPWRGFWQYLSDTWHRPSCCYTGPGWREFQLREEPQPTFYDLFMGFAAGAYSYRAFASHPFQLQGALISRLPVPLPSPQSASQGGEEGRRWLAASCGPYALCLLGQSEPINVHHEKGYAPLKIVWGDHTRSRSFVAQAGNMETISYEWHPDGQIGMEVVLGEIPNGEDKEKAREVVFFTEALEDSRIAVGGSAATTFKVGDEIEVSGGGLAVKLSFHIVEGDGNFVGHIMRGNRPSQIGLKGDHRLEAYDWQFFLRTVYRTQPCKIRVNITVNKGTP